MPLAPDALRAGNLHKFLRKFKAQDLSGPNSVPGQNLRIWDLGVHLDTANKLLNDAQHTAVVTVAMDVQRELERAEHEPFSRGYMLCLNVAKNAKRFKGKLPQTFEDIRTSAAGLNGDEASRELLRLEAAAQDKAPALCDLAVKSPAVFSDFYRATMSDLYNTESQRHFNMVYEDAMLQRMVFAGIGLAHGHLQPVLK